MTHPSLLPHRRAGRRGERTARRRRRVPSQDVADLAHARPPRPGDPAARGPPGVRGRRPHALEHAGAVRMEESPARRAPRCARSRTGTRGRRRPCPRVGADVARGDVAAAQRLDEPAVRAQQGLGLLGGSPDDHRLPAAEVQPGGAFL